MKLDNILQLPHVKVALSASSKDDVLAQIAETLTPATGLRESGRILDALQSRERLGSTGVGDGIAIPHARLKGLNELVGGLFLVEPGVAFDALDGGPVRLLFALLVPDSATGLHLRALARVSRVLKNEKARTAMLGSKSAEELYQMFLDEDARI